MWGGASHEFYSAKRKRVKKLRKHFLDNASASYEAKEKALLSGLQEIDAMYEEIASKNAFSGVQVFAPSVHKYLRRRFGSQLAAYLKHSNMQFSIAEELSNAGTPPDEISETLTMAFPGMDYEAEYHRMTAARGASSFMAGIDIPYRLVGKAVLGGFFPFVRVDAEAMNIEAKAMTGGGTLEMDMIDCKYRPFDARKMKKKHKPGKGKRRAEDVASTSAAASAASVVSAAIPAVASMPMMSIATPMPEAPPTTTLEDILS